MSVPKTFLSLFSLVLTATSVSAHPLASEVPMRSTTQHAREGTACSTHTVPIKIHSTNLDLDLTTPASQFEVTGILQEFFEVNSTFLQRHTKGKKDVIGTYNIATILCLPAGSKANETTLQILTHGLGLDHTYWDIAVPGYSYVDAAVEAGYATLSYDRLGVGASDHPDPINIVQSFAHVEILHGLVEALRHRGIGGKTFEHVVGVAHSYGSILQLGHTAKYPQDLDAVILTGIGETLTYLAFGLYSLDPTIAKQVNSSKFTGLSDGYLAFPSAVALQEPLFRYPYIQIEAFDFIFSNVGSFALSDYLTAANVITPATGYARPIDVVLPQYDFIFCQGDCSKLDGDQASGLITTYYPNSDSKHRSHYIVPDCGHNINGHKDAPNAFKQMLQFVEGIGL